MNVCILVPDADLEKVRDSALTLPLFANTPREKILNIALSETGENPPAFHFCVANVTQEVYDKMLEMRKYSEMSTEDPKAFLKSKNLKVISPPPQKFPV